MIEGGEKYVRPINIISASAGTGKTFRLSREYLAGLALGTTAGDTVAAASDGATNGRHDKGAIIATTFTNKAADELIERVRRCLLDEGEWLPAQEVLCGYLGTVNSICGRLLSEHAIAAGLSPDLTIISEERLSAVFAVAVDAVIHQFADEMHDAAVRLQVDNWRKDVLRLIDAARDNNISHEKLESLADHSWHRLQALLEPPRSDETGENLDERLAETVEKVLEDLRGIDDATDITRAAIEYLEEVNRRLKHGHTLIWQAWAKLSKLAVGKASKQAVLPLLEAASAHARHPRLHHDLKTTIYGAFRCASAAMEEYAAFKRRHGLIDFVDQEHLALRMLWDSQIREQFKQRIRLLLVDEFQDTSPIQLAVFMEMAQLVDYSVWVGDEKQSIFGFRGSDPELMQQAVSQLVSISKGKTERLKRSYRSRPNLVAFTNGLFSRCADLMKITSESALIDEVERKELDGQREALHFWWLPGKKQDVFLGALAQEVADLLAQSKTWLVVDRETRELRPIRGSDIAILCRTNASRIAAARALVAEGLTVATERDMLLETPECSLALASLRYLVDSDDTLALAEMLTALGTADDGNWLDRWLSSGRQSVEDSLPCARALKEARKLLSGCTPGQALEIALLHGGVVEAAMAWGNVRQRLANLDSLRGLSRSYEEVCLSTMTPATAAGLLVYLYKTVKDGGSQPANPDENGINVLTYHKSKGLEWPMVILVDLDYASRGSAFNITVESADGTINPLKPLEGRSIRYWPWPYGQQRKDIPLDTNAAKTQEGKKAFAHATAENLRLLYVGMTRARDYLVLTGRPFPSGTGWLDVLRDDQNQKILHLPLETVRHQIIDDIEESLACVVNRTEVRPASGSSKGDAATFISPFLRSSEDAASQFLPYYLNPSTASVQDFDVRDAEPLEVIRLGERIALTGSPDMQILGDCVHAFLGVDNRSKPRVDRLDTATKILNNWLVDNLTAESLLEMSDRLGRFLNETYPGCTTKSEVPARNRLGTRRVVGSIDLLVETKESNFVVIDHKSFPGRFEEWETRALAYNRQLALYKHVVETSTGTEVICQYIHMPIIGLMIRMKSEIA